MNIDEVSEELKINKPTLRYWENTGLIPRVNRNEHGYREYQQTDVNWLFYIQALRKSGMSIGQLKEFVCTYRDNEKPEIRKQILIDQRNSLMQKQNELQKTLNYLNFKIDNFGTHMINYENEKLIYTQKNSRN